MYLFLFISVAITLLEGFSTLALVTSGNWVILCGVGQSCALKGVEQYPWSVPTICEW